MMMTSKAMKDVTKALQRAHKKHSEAAERERGLRAELDVLAAELADARRTEEQAAVAAIDSLDSRAVASATAHIREIEDAIRVKRLQLNELERRTRDASSALDEALAAQRADEQAADYKALQAAVGETVKALADADDALRRAKSAASAIIQRHRASGGSVLGIGATFADRIRQLVVNNIGEVDLLERGGSPDPVGLLAPLVSDMAFLIVGGERNAA